LVKIFFLRYLIPFGLRLPKIQTPWFFAIGILGGSLFGDIAWMIKLGREIFIPGSSYAPVTFFIRIAWGFLIIQYHSLALFIESLTEKNYVMRPYQRYMTALSCGILIYFVVVAFCDSTFSTEQIRDFAFYSGNIFNYVHIEPLIMRFMVFHILLFLILPSLWFAMRRLRKATLPKMLTKQLKIFLIYLMVPYLVAEFMEALVIVFPVLQNYMYAIMGTSTILLMCMIFYGAIKVVRLRFLNFEKSSAGQSEFNFMNDFKYVLEQLSHATTTKELEAITKTFFKESFKIPLSKTVLIMRKVPSIGSGIGLSKREISAESFLTTHSDAICKMIKKTRILIIDEIAYDNFYEESEEHTKILHFLEEVQADIFLPIYERQVIIAYILVDRHARLAPREFYSSAERDEMVVFASYVENIVNLLQHNLSSLVQQEKELKEELYRKHQEINQYKESIHSFLRTTKPNNVGIIFYKNHRFTCANQAAQELINGSSVTDEVPLAKSLKQLISQVEEYKAPQAISVKEAEDRFTLVGVPNIDHQSIVITICREELSTVIKNQIDLLKDPTTWDYLLYLETTKAGQLINRLIPGSGETLLQFKISLLKTALSKKATLLEMVEEDLHATVDVLHHISLREKLYTLNLKGPSKSFDIAIKLFGINPIFGMNNETPLLRQLDKTGTLFIQNIHFLDIESQHYLAEFIKYGFYRIFKSDQKVPSDVRIVCSTNQNLQTLVQEGAFTKELFAELKAASMSMPSLLTLPEKDLHELAQGYTAQVLNRTGTTPSISLSEQDKKMLGYNRPMSLQELRERMQELIQAKEKGTQYQETQFHPAHQEISSDLVEAAQLGRHALKDQKIMMALWNKFKNQNKIATFLGVNRSSVNRRCKDYNLT
jgi:transcriptional regulator with PAS, ATPase and Fis domain